MLINLLEITFFNQYIISPKTWFHKVNNNIKIVIIFSTLLYIPYIDYLYIIFIIMIYSLIIICFKIQKDAFFKKYYLLFGLSMLILSIYINNINIKVNLFSIIPIISIILKKPIFVIKFNHSKKLCFKLYKSYFLLIVPKFTIRTILIYILYLLSLKILYKTTRYENVIIYFLMNYLTKKNTKKILIINFASNFLILVSNQIYYAGIAIKLRNNKYLLPKYTYYYGLQELLHNIFEEIYRISFILYCREINYKNLSIINIYS